MTFLVNLMFRRLGKSDGPICGGEGSLGEGIYIGGGGLIFGMLIVLHIWGCLSGGLIYGGHINGFSWYMVFINLCH